MQRLTEKRGPKIGARLLIAGVLVGFSSGLLGVATLSPWSMSQPEVRAELPGADERDEKQVASDKRIAVVVSTLLQREHISKRPMDDEISSRCLATFLKTLDPMKIYFYQSDVDEFKEWDDDLDDMVRKGDISPGYTIFKRFVKRIEERVAIVDEILKEKPNFELDEKFVTDRDTLKFPKTEAEARERWRKRIKYDLLVQKTNKVEEKEAVEKLQKRYHGFAKRMKQTDSDELLEMFVTALTTGFDPHTTYMSPGSLENFQILMKLELDGIGAGLMQEDSYTTVTKIIPGGAADKDGRLKPKDRVVGVGQGESGDIVDTVDMKLSDVVKMIRGKRDTKVRLQIIPVGKTEKKVITITRARIELKDSEARSEIVTAGKKADGSPYKIGVINLPSFYMDMEAAQRGDPMFKSTTRDCKKIIEGFKDKGVDAVMVDLRRNGGGSLSEAINLTGLFIDTGPVVQVKGSDGRVTAYSDYDRGMLWEGPLVVMISRHSASASEIFAGAIKDYDRGLVVGDKTTHGKGTVQSLVDLSRRLFRGVPSPPKLGALKVTIQQFYRPGGDSTQNRGVEADVELPALTSYLDIGESDLDFALDFDKVDAASHVKMGMVSPRVIDELASRSKQRIKGSEDFQKVARVIKRYTDRKERKYVSLNEKKFLADREDDDDQEDPEGPMVEDKPDPVVDRNFYVEEALNITVDYIEALKRQKVAAAR